MSASRPARQAAERRPFPRRFGIELLAILGVVVVGGLILLLLGPVLLSFGERRAHDADRGLLQRAVESYRAGSPPATRPWPTLSGRSGQPAEGGLPAFQCNGSDGTEVCSWIDIELLATDGFIAGADAIASADSTRNVSATNAPSGRYGWYVDAQGQVASSPPFSSDVGYP
jgi:hypothetical protein